MEAPRRGTAVGLGLRVLPTLKGSMQLGLDVEAILKAGLVEAFRCQSAQHLVSVCDLPPCYHSYLQVRVKSGQRWIDTITILPPYVFRLGWSTTLSRSST